MDRLFAVVLMLVGGALGVAGGYACWGNTRPVSAALDAQAMHLEALSQRIERLQKNQQVALASCALSTLAAPPPAVAATGSAPVPAPAATAARAEPPDTFDPKREEALVHGHQLLEQALRSGNWTGADSSELRQLSAQLDAERQVELLSSVARALNDGQLKWVGEGAPF